MNSFEWDENEVTCPACGHQWRDLWDYQWGSASSIDVNCSECDAKLELHCETTYRYAAQLGWGEDRAREQREKWLAERETAALQGEPKHLEP